MNFVAENDELQFCIWEIIVQNHTTEIGCPAEAFVYLLDKYWND